MYGMDKSLIRQALKKRKERSAGEWGPEWKDEKSSPDDGLSPQLKEEDRFNADPVERNPVQTQVDEGGDEGRGVDLDSPTAESVDLEAQKVLGQKPIDTLKSPRETGDIYEDGVSGEDLDLDSMVDNAVIGRLGEGDTPRNLWERVQQNIRKKKKKGSNINNSRGNNEY